MLRKSVLIVEDDVLNMKLFQDVLTAHGYRTLSARDGHQALTICREERPDIVIMDIQLPDMSGLVVTRAIRRDPDIRATPIIAVTACAMRGDEEKVRVGGCDSYIAKPVLIDTLIAEVARFIGSSTADPRAAIAG